MCPDAVTASGTSLCQELLFCKFPESDIPFPKEENMLDKTCRAFIDELGSTAPVPGGGSASALVGAIGIALGTMAGLLTTGKKSAAAHEEELQELIRLSVSMTERFKEAVNRDVTAFEPLAQAYKLPNQTDEEKKQRAEEIQKHLITATEAPLELTELCTEALELLERYSGIANKMVISDVGVGAAVCEAALKGARLNVLINLRSMKDETARKALSDRLETACDKGLRSAELCYGRVEEACK